MTQVLEVEVLKRLKARCSMVDAAAAGAVLLLLLLLVLLTDRLLQRRRSANEVGVELHLIVVRTR